MRVCACKQLQVQISPRFHIQTLWHKQFWDFLSVFSIGSMVSGQLANSKSEGGPVNQREGQNHNWIPCCFWLKAGLNVKLHIQVLIFWLRKASRLEPRLESDEFSGFHVWHFSGHVYIAHLRISHNASDLEVNIRGQYTSTCYVQQVAINIYIKMFNFLLTIQGVTRTIIGNGIFILYNWYTNVYIVNNPFQECQE